MKILVIAPTPFFSDRGCHVRIFEEARALQKQGHTVRIVTYHLGSDPEGVSVDRIVTIPWYRKTEAGPSWHKLYLDALLLFKALWVNTSYRADVIHGHLHEGCLIGWIVARLFGKKFVFDYQGSLTEESLSHNFFRKQGFFYTVFSFIERWIDRRADAILVSSASHVHRLTHTSRIDQRKITVVPDGLGSNFLTAQHTSDGGRPNTVVYLGALTQYQGIDLLLESARLVRKSIPTVRFEIFGYPDHEYRKKAYALGISDFVFFEGRIPYDRALEYVGRGTVAVSPKVSTTESNGKLLVYMQAGLPVVCFDSEVNRELLGDLGFFVGERSPEAFAERLVSVLQQSNESRVILSTKLTARIREKFSWSEQVKKIVSIYDELSS